MSHPIMFDDADPVLARVRAIALALPGAREKVSHGRPVFFTTKTFCWYGGSVRRGAGDWEQHDQSVLVQADLVGREALRGRPESFVPGYLGPSGWTGLDLDDDTDWEEIAELIEDSYRATAPKRLVASLDA